MSTAASAPTLSPAVIDALLLDYSTPDLSLSEIAAKHALPIRQLVRLFSCPEMQAELDAMALVIRRRAAFIAQQSIALVSRSLRRTVADYDDAAESHPIDPTDPQQATLRTRLREQARKAAGVLLKIAKDDIQPTPVEHLRADHETAPPTTDDSSSCEPHADRPDRTGEPALQVLSVPIRRAALTPAAPTATSPIAPAHSP